MKIMITKTQLFGMLIISLFAVALPAATESEFEGYIYQNGTSDGTLLYTQKEFLEVIDDRTIRTHEYYRENGSIAAYERIETSGDIFFFYETEIADLGMRGVVIRNGSRMTIIQSQDGKTKSRIQDWDDSLVAGPMLPQYIAENRYRISDGETVEFKLPFFDMQRLIAFKLSGKKGVDDNGQLTVQMKLKSLFFGMLINPIDFVVDMKTGRLLEIHGPTILPEPGSLKKNKFLNASIKYYYNKDEEALS